MTMTGLTDGDNYETGHGYLDVKLAVKDWKKLANSLQIGQSEQKRFAHRLDSRI